MGERGRRWLVAIVALALAAAHLAAPSLSIDAITLAPVAIAGAALLLPSVSSMVPYVRRVRAAGLEVELRDDVKELGRKVDTASVAVEAQSEATPGGGYEVDDVVEEAARDPRAALLLISARLEKLVRERLAEARLQPRFGLAPAVELGVQQGLFDPAVMPAVRDFATLRNRVAHGEAFDVSDDTVLALVAVGTDLLKLLAVQRSPEKERQPSHPTASTP